MKKPGAGIFYALTTVSLMFCGACGSKSSTDGATDACGRIVSKTQSCGTVSAADADKQVQSCRTLYASTSGCKAAADTLAACADVATCDGIKGTACTAQAANFVAVCDDSVTQPTSN